jgi:hypothetical protein
MPGEKEERYDEAVKAAREALAKLRESCVEMDYEFSDEVVNLVFAIKKP